MTTTQPEEATMNERVLKTAALLGDVARFLRNRVGDTAAISLAIICEHDQRDLHRLVDDARFAMREAS